MSTAAFATLAFARKLASAGLPPEQADAIAEAFRDATGEDPVTRDFLEAKLKAAKSEIIKWVAGLLLGQAVLIVTVVKLS